MSLHRVACDCKCQDISGNCGEYEDCLTTLKLNYSFPAFTAKTEWGSSVGTSTATVSVNSGDLNMFTHENCISDSCGYQGIKADECVEQQRCHTESAYTAPVDDAVDCWHGDVYEDFKGEQIAEPQPNPFGDFSAIWNNCDCVEQLTGSGFYSAEIKEAYKRHQTRTEEYWCQCSLGCGDPDADYHGGMCSDCYDGYQQVWYRGAVSRMTFGKLIYKGDSSCAGEYTLPNSTLGNNRWYLALGTQIRTGIVARSRNCQGNWGALTYYVDCNSSSGDCSNCRDNDRSRSWNCNGNNGSDFGESPSPSAFWTCGEEPYGTNCNSGTNSMYQTSTIWGLPVEIQDCKDLVGVGIATSGVELLRKYCPAYDGAYGADARSIGDNAVTTYCEAGFEASTWTIGEP